MSLSAVFCPRMADQKKLRSRVALTIRDILAMHIMCRRWAAVELRLDETEARRGSIEQRPACQPPLDDQVCTLNVCRSFQHPESVHQKGAGPRLGDSSIFLANQPRGARLICIHPMIIGRSSVGLLTGRVACRNHTGMQVIFCNTSRAAKRADSGGRCMEPAYDTFSTTYITCGQIVTTRTGRESWKLQAIGPTNQ